MTSHENYENVQFKTVDGITLRGNLSPRRSDAHRSLGILVERHRILVRRSTRQTGQSRRVRLPDNHMGGFEDAVRLADAGFAGLGGEGYVGVAGSAERIV